MLTVEEKKEEFIQKAIKAGVSLSRHCRNCWTGERTSSCIEASRIVHWKSLVAIAIRGSRPLLGFADIADLHNIIYLGRQDQHSWNADRWEQELRAYVEMR